MNRAGSAHLVGGGWSLVLMGAIGVLAGATEARAAGCHVPDRLVRTANLSWENELSLDREAGWAAPAPPVLSRPPCQGEVPRLLEPTGGPIVAAIEARGTSLTIRNPSRPVLRAPIRSHEEPPGGRLDRPPRTRLHMS